MVSVKWREYRVRVSMYEKIKSPSYRGTDQTLISNDYQSLTGNSQVTLEIRSIPVCLEIVGLM